MKKKTEYQIFKDYPRHPEFWDGPYRTLELALKDWREKYMNEKGAQDFVVARVTYTPIKRTNEPVRRPTRHR